MITLINEPDIEWRLNNRCYDYAGADVLDEAAIISELPRWSNKNAILIAVKNNGYREPEPLRHPHSRGIADPVQLVQWLKPRNDFGNRQPKTLLFFC